MLEGQTEVARDGAYIVTDASALELMSRKDAKANGLTRYFTGLSCSRGHIAQRMVSNKECIECSHANRAARHERERDAERAYSRAYYWANTDQCKETTRNAAKRNRKARNAYNKAYLLTNPDRAEEYRRRNFEKRGPINAQNAREWRKANTARQMFHRSARRGMQAGAIPSVPDAFVPVMNSEIVAMYDLRAAISKATGVRHAVDHIFPLKKGGVHAPWNLQVITADENQRKKDKWPDTEPLFVNWHGMLVMRAA